MSQGSREAPVPCGEKSLPSSSLFQGERDLAGTTGSAAFAPTLCLYGKKKKSDHKTGLKSSVYQG